jgi:competence protein ComEC
VAGQVVAALAIVGVTAYAGYQLLQRSIDEQTQENAFRRVVPNTGEPRTWEKGELEILLPSGADWGKDLPEYNRKHGWEQVKELPGIEDKGDIGEVIDDGEIIKLPGAYEGDYDFIIGDNPNAPGEVVLRLLQKESEEEAVVIDAYDPMDQTEVTDEIIQQVNEEIDSEEQISKEEVEEVINGDPEEVTTGKSWQNVFFKISEGVRVGIRQVPREVQQFGLSTAISVTVNVVDSDSDDEDDEDDDEEDEEPDDVEVSFIDIGKGTSTLIDGPEENDTMLVDVGSSQSETDILETLDDRDINYIDDLVITHNHSDHVGGRTANGLEEIVEQQSIGKMHFSGINNVYPDAGKDRPIQNETTEVVRTGTFETSTLERGDGTKLTPDGESYEVKVLNPRPGEAEEEEGASGKALDRQSIVLKVIYEGQSVLLSSDIRTDGGKNVREKDLAENVTQQLDATVMQASHHGAATANGETYLETVSPSYVVVSSEYPDIPRQNPDKEALRRIRNETTDVYWTADGNYHGTIEFTLNNSEIDPDKNIDTEYDRPAEVNKIIQELPGPSITVAKMNADASGDDHENLNDEYVVFENTGAPRWISLDGRSVTRQAIPTRSLVVSRLLPAHQSDSRQDWDRTLTMNSTGVGIVRSGTMVVMSSP